MAKITGPLHSTEARGRMGGLIFNSWRGISYAKAKQAPAQPRSPLQLTLRSLGIQLARAWQALDQADRDTWNDYAVAHQDIDWTGNAKRLSGLNWYIRCNVRLLLQGAASVDTAPVTVAPGPVGGLGLTPGAGTLDVAWTSPSTGATNVEIWVDGPHSAGRIGSLVRARYQASEAGDTSPLGLTALQPGTFTVYARQMDVANGLTSTWVTASDVVT